MVNAGKEAGERARWGRIDRHDVIIQELQWRVLEQDGI